MIEEITEKHIPGMVETRLEAFSDSFLGSLGAEALTILYEEICSSPIACGYVYTDNSRVGGFIFASLTPDLLPFYRQLIKKRAISFTIVLLKKFLKNPGILKETLRRLSPLLRGYLKRLLIKPSSCSVDADHDVEGSKVADIPAIMVNKGYQGKGVARELMKAMLAELKRRGIKEVYLSTGVDNLAANRYYRAMGFKLINTYTEFGGVKQNRYRLILG